MKKIAILISLYFQALGCQHGESMVPADNIKAIEIDFYKNSYVNGKNTDSTISNPVKINYIINQLNKAELEPAVFKATYKLRIVYDNGNNMLILCNGNRIKLNGLTFKTPTPIIKLTE
jgi:hypothetical protein